MSMEQIEKNNANEAVEPTAFVRRPYSVKEWAVNSVNCCNGCSHDCLYCYARDMAWRFRRYPRDLWKHEAVRQRDVERNYGLMEGRVMFPTSHDITPSNLDACLTVLEKLLQAGNEVLLVSKPHLECIEAIIDRFQAYKGNLIFRFTITAMNNDLLRVWEPGAPRFEERLDCLRQCRLAGYQTSVSIEPMLDSEHVDELVAAVAPFVTDSIWIGKMNKLSQRVIVKNPVQAIAVHDIEEGQQDDRIIWIFEQLKHHPKVKWKDSIKKVVGIPPARAPGLDE